MDNEYIYIKGSKHRLYTGSRGGKYWMDKHRKKHYLKNNTPKREDPKVSNEVEETVYICYFNELDPNTGERIDDFKEWTRASSEQEARDYFEEEHWHSISEGKLEIDMIVKE